MQVTPVDGIPFDRTFYYKLKYHALVVLAALVGVKLLLAPLVVLVSFFYFNILKGELFSCIYNIVLKVTYMPEKQNILFSR